MRVVILLVVKCVDMTCLVCMQRPIVWCRFTIDVVVLATRTVGGYQNSVKYGGYENKFNVLVVRISITGELCDSKPCCMCVNLMKMNGIKKVYYSDTNGNICCQKVSQISDDEIYVSHGLKLMIGDGGYANKKLPLTRGQKTLLILGGLASPHTPH